MRLDGKVALVTGAAQGIGAAIAREFASEGCVVICIDKGSHVADTARAIGVAEGSACGLQLDITDHAAYARI